jgi:dTDP-4-amino-4,6-dideoxygalactose transaminase
VPGAQSLRGNRNWVWERTSSATEPAISDRNGVHAMISSIQPFAQPIFVTRPALPPLEEFCRGLQGIWERAWLTNDGPLVQQFREKLLQFLPADHGSLFSNGTLALQIALQALGLTGDVITTPYTFVATTHALFWNKLRPVFADIKPDCYCIDPDAIEAAITPWTSAILAVHVYGHPCRHQELERIARVHGLKLIYDAAHAFGVEVDGMPIGSLGDVSMFSFHATKVFHSIEGGLLLFRDASLQARVDYLKNFGFESETEVVMPGTNAKMSEFHALMGLLLLERFELMVEKRRKLSERYRVRLAGIPGIHLLNPPVGNVRYNYAYLVLEVDAGEFGMERDRLYDWLRVYNVIARRYFYPIVPDLPCYRNMFSGLHLPVARAVASRILTLPLYSDLGLETVDRICDMIEAFHHRSRGAVARQAANPEEVAVGD